MTAWMHHFPQADQSALQSLLDTKKDWVCQEKKGFLRYRQPLDAVSHLSASTSVCDKDVVIIGDAKEVNEQERALVLKSLIDFIPWRKGPFSVFGIEIDAEWRSQRKWNRLLPHLPNLCGKIIADIGSNNGYYMFRMTSFNPAFVLGFEPFVQHYYAFHLLNGFARKKNLQTELLGVEHLSLFPESFDVIFCMGVLYHRSSPVETLRDIAAALRPGGFLLLESQAIPGSEPFALFPEKTYAKVPGTWFVPTASCLQNWLTRTGFSRVELLCEHPMSAVEQRRTDWMQFESFEDFIDKQDPSRTIEGYPAPWRVFFKAMKE